MKLRNILTVGILFFLNNIITFSSEWFFILKPNEIKMESSVVMQTPAWYYKKIATTKDFYYIANLSFFTTKTFVGPYKDSLVVSNVNKKRWPVLYISNDKSEILTWKETPNFNYTYMASGYPLLIQNSAKSKLGKTYFHKRRCPRTAIGIMPNGNVLVYVTNSANIQSLQNRMYELGCVSALNFDGGGSTFLLGNGESIFPKKSSRRYPNVLYWKKDL
jgi:hypothetical protein